MPKPKPKDLSVAEKDLLAYARSVKEKMGWCITGSRICRLRTIRKLVKRGLMAELPELVTMQDDDGSEIYPARYRTGYELTTEGRTMAEKLEEFPDVQA